VIEEHSEQEELQCSACGALCLPGARHCPSCGSELGMVCLHCGALNAATAQFCQNCGQSFNIVEPILERVTSGRYGWLTRVQQDADSVKELEEKASQARLSAMWEIEAQRREELSQARAERERQQRILVWGSVGIAAAFIAIILITFILLTTHAPAFQDIAFL